MAENTIYVAPVGNHGYNSLWNLIDKTLVRLKLQEPLEKHAEAVDKERGSIELEYRGRRGAWVTAILEMVERRADEWLDQIRLVYSDVWQQQGHANSSDFLRTLRDNIVEPVVRARTSGEVSSFKRMWDRCGFPGRQVLESQLATFERTMRSLEHRWKTKFEIEAKELEYAAHRSSGVPKASQQPLQQDPQGIYQVDAGEEAETPPGQSSQLQPTGGLRKTRIIASKYRSTLKRAIQLRLTQEPLSTDRDICHWLDEEGVCDLPKDWKTKADDRSFASAYMNSRNRSKIQVTISKVRSDMRKSHLL